MRFGTFEVGDIAPDPTTGEISDLIEVGPAGGTSREARP